MKIEIPAAAILLAALTACSGPDGRGKTAYRTAQITRTDIVRTVEATGTVTPRNSPSGIPVGAQVNGKIIKLLADYNSTVTNGQVVALIDPLVYEANHKSALARLHVNRANVSVCEANIRSREAELALAEKTQKRKRALVDKKLAPQADLDTAEETLAKARAALDSARASLASAKASVEQSEADVSQAAANLKYCTIVSPVNGVVIDRKVEEGQTVVSSMNAVPVLTIAEDLSTVWVEATVPEADVGGIKTGQTVTFTADAYRRKFTGRVIQIRRAATTTSNVVTFPVIIEAENPGEMLFPGMTATLSIETARAEGVLAVPSGAFRFRPREGDPAAALAADAPRGSVLWLAGADGKIEPVAVEKGITDDSFIEVSSPVPLEGREVVVGYETSASAKGSDKVNPFKPKFPERNKNKGTAPAPRAK